MQAFKRRIYGSLGEMAADLVWPLRHWARLRQAMRGRLVSAQFRERLMMAVTAVGESKRGKDRQLIGNPGD